MRRGSPTDPSLCFWAEAHNGGPTPAHYGALFLLLALLLLLLLLLFLLLVMFCFFMCVCVVDEAVARACVCDDFVCAVAARTEVFAASWNCSTLLRMLFVVMQRFSVGGSFASIVLGFDVLHDGSSGIPLWCFANPCCVVIAFGLNLLGNKIVHRVSRTVSPVAC